MAIEDRDLAVGTRLVARYKKLTYFYEVVATEQGLRYRLEDGRAFKSPSAAGTAVLGGQACNGWRFWSVVMAVDQPADRAVAPEDALAAGPSRKARAGKVIRRVPNQQGTPEGQTRWFCAGCADSFFGEGSDRPAACPKGHGADLDANGDLVTVTVPAATPVGGPRTVLVE